MFAAELDLGGRAYTVLAFHPSAPIVGVADAGHRRRLEARHGAGLLILADDHDTYQVRVGTDYSVDPRHLTRRTPR